MQRLEITVVRGWKMVQNFGISVTSSKMSVDWGPTPKINTLLRQYHFCQLENLRVSNHHHLLRIYDRLPKKISLSEHGGGFFSTPRRTGRLRYLTLPTRGSFQKPNVKYDIYGNLASFVFIRRRVIRCLLVYLVGLRHTESIG